MLVTVIPELNKIIESALVSKNKKPCTQGAVVEINLCVEWQQCGALKDDCMQA